MNLDVITASLEKVKGLFSNLPRQKCPISFPSGSPKNESCAVLALIELHWVIVALRHGLKKPCNHRDRTWYYYSARFTSCVMDHYRTHEYRNQAPEQGKFRSCIIRVALVAIIRDTMIMALMNEAIEKLYYLIALILNNLALYSGSLPNLGREQLK